MVVVVAVAVTYLYNIIGWGNYPNFGFGFRSTTGLGAIGTVSENGLAAGMQVGDRILRVNGKTYGSLKEFRAAMNRGLGEDNTYLLERNGRQLEVTITSIPVGLKRAASRSGLPYIVGLCYALIGTLVFLMKPHQRTSWIFYLFATTFGLYITFLYQSGKISPGWLENIQILVYTFTPAAFIHLTLGFPEERVLFTRRKYFQVIPYLVSALMFLGLRSSAPTIGEAPKIWFLATVAYIAVGVFIFLGSCTQLLVSSYSEIVKIRSKMILLGAAITASLPLANLVSSAVFGKYILPGINYQLPFLIVFPLFVGYAIVRHDLFEFDTIIKRTYGYVLTTGTIAGVYGLLVLISNVAFGAERLSTRPYCSRSGGNSCSANNSVTRL